MIYLKNNEYVQDTNSFVYCISVYKIFQKRAELVSEKYYSSKNVLKFKKKDLKLKKKDYILHRYVDLIGAPLEYLLNNNYKKVL